MHGEIARRHIFRTGQRSANSFAELCNCSFDGRFDLAALRMLLGIKVGLPFLKEPVTSRPLNSITAPYCILIFSQYTAVVCHDQIDHKCDPAHICEAGGSVATHRPAGISELARHER